jgi:hypothetical protein
VRLSAEPRNTRHVKTALCGGEFSSRLIFICGIGARRGGTINNQTKSSINSISLSLPITLSIYSARCPRRS